MRLENEFDLVDGYLPLAIIDRYKILSRLGSGSFGSVYLAYDTISDTRVAIKSLPADIHHNQILQESIKANFKMVSKLHHPNIASLLVLHIVAEVKYPDALFEEEINIRAGDYLVVMEYAPGEPLSLWLKKIGIVSARIKCDIADQISNALDYAHSQGIIHRDIKPSNIIIQKLGNPNECIDEHSKFHIRVLDFGLASEVHLSQNRCSCDGRDYAGTRAYMAPEQWRGKHVTAAVDQYALAVLLYELTYKRVPFETAFSSGDPLMMYAAVMNSEPEFDIHTFPRVKAVINKGLSKEPSDRYPSCCAFAEAYRNANNFTMDEYRDYMRRRAEESLKAGRTKEAAMQMAFAQSGTLARSKLFMSLGAIEENADNQVNFITVDNQEKQSFWLSMWFFIQAELKLALKGKSGLVNLLEFDAANDDLDSLPEEIATIVAAVRERFGRDRIKNIVHVVTRIYPRIIATLRSFNKDIPEDVGFVEKNFVQLHEVTSVRLFVAAFIGITELKLHKNQ